VYLFFSKDQAMIENPSENHRIIMDRIEQNERKSNWAMFKIALCLWSCWCISALFL